jgi:magnesium chelatase family protein
MCNAQLDGELLLETCKTSPRSWQLLERALEEFALSARVHQRVCRVARTIADLEGDRTIRSAHMAEALAMRQLDRNH